jgi:hypothetical protein
MTQLLPQRFDLSALLAVEISDILYTQFQGFPLDRKTLEDVFFLWYRIKDAVLASADIEEKDAATA